jgi:hypothetical protein
MIWIRGRKNIIGHIRPHITRGIVIPVHFRGHGLDLCDRNALGENAARVDIALNIVLAPLPGPVRAPFDACARCTLVVGALRS